MRSGGRLGHVSSNQMIFVKVVAEYAYHDHMKIEKGVSRRFVNLSSYNFITQRLLQHDFHRRR